MLSRPGNPNLMIWPTLPAPGPGSGTSSCWSRTTRPVSCLPGMMAVAAETLPASGKPGTLCHFSSVHLLPPLLSPSLPSSQPTEAAPATPKHLTAALMLFTPCLLDRLQTSGSRVSWSWKGSLNLDQRVFNLNRPRRIHRYTKKCHQGSSLNNTSSCLPWPERGPDVYQ